ncbi:site-specific DNA-methyltransferase [Rhizobium ruizarguesonis]
MTSTTMHDGRVVLHQEDCRDVLRGLTDNSIDSVVTDPPYALVSIQKRFANSPRNEKTENPVNPYGRTGRGFMGKTWDNGEVAFSDEFWAEVLRVLKPGGHVVAFSGTRTYHRMAVAIEDAGFEIRDQLGWVYGSGFPKSHNQHGDWEGWGTALKPAWEPICLARKPLSGTVAANLEAWGVGAINVDGCRVSMSEGEKISPRGSMDAQTDIHEGWSRPWMADKGKSDARLTAAIDRAETLGRWPANILHDGSEEVLAAFPDTKSGSRKAGEYGLMSYHGADAAPMPAVDGDSGSAARFFYCAKASRADRDAGLESFEAKNDTGHRKTNLETADRPHLRGLTKRANIHPTVKPTTLMQWLCRLITPPGGIILDPFMGSGSTGKAAVLEGFQFVGCEREDEYMPIAVARIAWAIGASSTTTPGSDPVAAPQPVAAPANDNSPVGDLFAQAGAA